MEELLIEHWLNKFTPKFNHIDTNASFDLGFGQGSMFETYGEEMQYVRDFQKENPNKVWTIVEAEGEFYLMAGLHFVNRIGYILSNEDWTEEELPNDYLFD